MITEPTAILVGCVGQKQASAMPARDLYSSELFRRRRQYADARKAPWLLVSALYGIVEPEAVIEPYDLRLNDVPARERLALGEKMAKQLEQHFGDLRGRLFEVHAGEIYVRTLRDALVPRGATVKHPLRGLRIGEQLAWYGGARPSSRTQGQESEATPPRRPAPPARNSRRCSRSDVDRALEALDRNPRRVPAAKWSELGGLEQPGLYSWWVDAKGAADLSVGLGESVSAGRIYAGLTGATKWPSGRSGAMTLRDRIRMHMGGRIEGSTFRWTLAACLLRPLNLEVAGRKKLERASEQRLSAWMMEHLDVAAHPFPDRDALGDLEEHVLAVLDPPLNLRGATSTAVRHRLQPLRRRLSAGGGPGKRPKTG